VFFNFYQQKTIRNVMDFMEDMIANLKLMEPILKELEETVMNKLVTQDKGSELDFDEKHQVG
jgi:hypothetical protein